MSLLLPPLHEPPRSLKFGGTADLVNHGSHESLDDLYTWTWLSWIYPTALTGDAAIFYKGPSSGRRMLALHWAGNGGLLGIVSTTSANDDASAQSAQVVIQDRWNLVGATYDNADPGRAYKIYHALEGELLSEISYTYQEDGGATLTSEAAYDMKVGNSYPENTPFPGNIAWAGHWNRVLTLGEMRAQQVRAHVTPGCVLFSRYGARGGGVQVDESPFGNHGRVQGATPVSAGVDRFVSPRPRIAAKATPKRVLAVRQTEKTRTGLHGSLTFDGSTSYVNCGSGSTLDNIQPIYTYVTWFKSFDATSAGQGLQVICQKGFFAQGVWNLSCCENVDGRIEGFVRGTGTNGTVRNQANEMRSNQWVFVAMTMELAGGAAAQKLYIGDETRPAQEPVYVGGGIGQIDWGSPHTSNASEPFIIGARATAYDTNLFGRIAFLGVWDRRLSPAEIHQQQLSPHVTDGCRGFWRLGSGNVNSIEDETGNGNTGTPNAVTYSGDVPIPTFAPRARFVPGAAAGGATTYTLTAQAGAYPFTGTSAGLSVTRALTAQAGAYPFTGTSAGLSVTRALTAQAGAYPFTGTSAGLSVTRALTAQAGAYPFTGTSAGLSVTRALTANAGAYPFTGTSAAIATTRVLTANAGAYPFTGTSADLNLSGSVTLTAQTGAYPFAGTAANLGRILEDLGALSGAFAFTGTAADLLLSWDLAASAGAYPFTGTAAGLTATVAGGVEGFERKAAGLHVKRNFAGFDAIRNHQGADVPRNFSGST